LLASIAYAKRQKRNQNPLDELILWSRKTVIGGTKPATWGITEDR